MRTNVFSLVKIANIIFLILCFGSSNAQDVNKRLISEKRSLNEKTMNVYYSYNTSGYLSKIEYEKSHEITLNYNDSNELKSFVKKFNNKEYGVYDVFYVIFNRISADTIKSKIFIVPPSMKVLGEIATATLEVMAEYTQILDNLEQTIKVESSDGEIIEFEYDNKYNLIAKKSCNPKLEKTGFKEDSKQEYTFKYDNNINPLHKCLPTWAYFNVLNISGGVNNCIQLKHCNALGKEASYNYKHLYDNDKYPVKTEYEDKSIKSYCYE